RRLEGRVTGLALLRFTGRDPHPHLHPVPEPFEGRGEVGFTFLEKVPDFFVPKQALAVAERDGGGASQGAPHHPLVLTQAVERRRPHLHFRDPRREAAREELADRSAIDALQVASGASVVRTADAV